MGHGQLFKAKMFQRDAGVIALRAKSDIDQCCRFLGIGHRPLPFKGKALAWFPPGDLTCTDDKIGAAFIDFLQIAHAAAFAKFHDTRSIADQAVARPLLPPVINLIGKLIKGGGGVTFNAKRNKGFG